MKLKYISLILLTSFLGQAKAMENDPFETLKVKLSENTKIKNFPRGRIGNFYEGYHQQRANGSAQQNAQDILKSITPLIKGKEIWEKHKIFDKAVSLLSDRYKTETILAIYHHQEASLDIKALISTRYLNKK